MAIWHIEVLRLSAARPLLFLIPHKRDKSQIKLYRKESEPLYKYMSSHSGSLHRKPIDGTAERAGRATAIAAALAGRVRWRREVFAREPHHPVLSLAAKGLPSVQHLVRIGARVRTRVPGLR